MRGPQPLIDERIDDVLAGKTQVLELDFSAPGEGQVEALLGLLKERIPLMELHMHSCALSPHEWRLIFSALENHPTLEHLDVSQNSFRATPDPELATVPAIAKLLENPPKHLRTLNLEENPLGGIGVADAEGIVKAIGAVKTLRSLSVGGQDRSVSYFFEYAPKLPGLGVDLLEISLKNTWWAQSVLDNMSILLENNRTLCLLDIHNDRSATYSSEKLNRFANAIRAQGNVILYDGIQSEEIKAAVQENRVAAGIDATQLLTANLETFSERELMRMFDGISAVTYLLRTEHDCSEKEVSQLLGKLILACRKKDVDPLPMLFCGLPFDVAQDAVVAAGEIVSPLTQDSKPADWFLRMAAEGRGAAAFNQLTHYTRTQARILYRALPEEQQAQVFSMHQLNALPAFIKGAPQGRGVG